MNTDVDPSTESLEHSDDKHMLTTVDNPYSPFTQFDEWFAYDSIKGYNTSSFMARIANVHDDLSETLLDEVIEEAIDEIVRENITGMYRKVTQQEYEKN